MFRSGLLPILLLLGRPVDAAMETAAVPTAGRFTPRVVCIASPDHSYAAYLPAAFESTRPWPILLCFDPIGEGDLPVRLFHAAAEKHGFLVVGSYNSRNGPERDNGVAVAALLRDVCKRWPIDRRRVYAVGFSGGARVASSLGLSGVARGVIAVGAGFPAGVKPPEEIGFDFYGAVGAQDPNREEMEEIDWALKARSAAHVLRLFPGGHEWLPERLTDEALDWLDAQFRHAGIRDRYTALIRGEFQERWAAARALSPRDAFLEHRALVSDFRGLPDLTEVHQALKALGAGAGIGEPERQAAQQRSAALAEYLRLARNPASPAAAALVAQWQERSCVPDDTPVRREARSLLAGVLLRCAVDARTRLAEGIRPPAAAAAGALAVQLRPESPVLAFNLACIQSLDGNPTVALASLQLAVRRGFTDARLAWNEPALAPLRREPAFLAVLATMKALSPAAIKSRDGAGD